MGNQNVDFLTGSDTGENASSAIQPISNTEPASATTFNRPPENLRIRTELLKKYVEDGKFLHDADRSLVLSGGGTITWNGTVANGGDGKFTLTSSLSLRPFLAPATSTAAKVSYGTALLNEVVVSTILSVAFGVNPPRAYSGANKITLDVTDTLGATTAATVDGANSNHFHITLDSTVVTANALVSFIQGSAVFQAGGLTASLGAGSTGTNLVKSGGLTKTLLSGAVDAELHTITAAGLAAFFDATHVMTEGDVLAVYYPDLTYGTNGGRRQSLPDTPEASSNVDSNLFLVRLNPEKVPYALPIATIIGGNLVLSNGLTLLQNEGVTLTGAYVRKGGDSMSGELTVLPSSGNTTAISGVGAGNGIGVSGQGGPSGGQGVYGLGVLGGSGVYAQGGTSSGAGVAAFGGTNGNGVTATGNGTGHGVVGTSGSGGAANGVRGVGATGTGNAGVYGLGGSTGGAGVTGVGGGSTGVGVTGTGGTNGIGVQGTGNGTGNGVVGAGGATNGIGVVGTGSGTGYGVKGTGGSGSGATTSPAGVYGIGGNPSGTAGSTGGPGGSFVGATGSSRSGTTPGVGLVVVGGEDTDDSGGAVGLTVTGGSSGGGTGADAIHATGSASAAAGADNGGNGVVGTGGAGTGAGVDGIGVVGNGGGAGGTGVSGTGAANGIGVVGQGGSTSGIGVTGTGGPNSIGVRGTGNGSGAGVYGISQGTGAGVWALGSATGPALLLQPRSGVPASPVAGATVIDTGDPAGTTYKFYDGSTWRKANRRTVRHPLIHYANTNGTPHYNSTNLDYYFPSANSALQETTDVISFYKHVDHGRLDHLLLALSGAADGYSASMDLGIKINVWNQSAGGGLASALSIYDVLSITSNGIKTLIGEYSLTSLADGVYAVTLEIEAFNGGTFNVTTGTGTIFNGAGTGFWCDMVSLVATN